LVVCACLVTAPVSAAFAQETAPPNAQSADKTAPSYDLKAQAALDLQQLQQKYTTLAQAIPQEKYSWRPAEGVRSINELFLHVAGAGFYFPTLKGTPAAPGFTPKDFEKSTTDQAWSSGKRRRRRLSHGRPRARASRTSHRLLVFGRRGASMDSRSAEKKSQGSARLIHTRLIHKCSGKVVAVSQLLRFRCKVW
jgi:hypothetical protein